jgi:chromate transporter
MGQPARLPIPGRGLAAGCHDSGVNSSEPQSVHLVPFREAVRTWWSISLQTFGGPAGQIAVMHRVLVDQKRWIGERRFLHALNYCMLLPGPEAQQLAIYIGWLLNGTRGGLIAGSFFVLPGLVALLILSAIYVSFGNSLVVSSLFLGLSAAVFAIVVQAVLRVARRSLLNSQLRAIALLAFLALTIAKTPFPVVIALAAVAGWAGARWWPTPNSTAVEPDSDQAPPVVPDTLLHRESPGLVRSAKVAAIGVALWFSPVLVLAFWLGREHIIVQQGTFFSGTAMVTFGGAYAVLAYVAHRAVETYGWLSAAEMTRGLALAETTPGPLIIVVQFVAFLGAYRNPGSLSPWVAAVIAALLTCWVTFVPSFLWIFLGAPYVERLRANKALAAALTGISAAVVGVIAQLALYFATHTFFSRQTRVDFGWFSWQLPQLASLQWPSVLLAMIAAWLIFRRGWPLLRVLGVAAGLGLVVGFLGWT